jgi:hypothetical protein
MNENQKIDHFFSRDRAVCVRSLTQTGQIAAEMWQTCGRISTNLIPTTSPATRYSSTAQAIPSRSVTAPKPDRTSCPAATISKKLDFP